MVDSDVDGVVVGCVVVVVVESFVNHLYSTGREKISKKENLDYSTWNRGEH